MIFLDYIIIQCLKYVICQKYSYFFVFGGCFVLLQDSSGLLVVSIYVDMQIYFICFVKKKLKLYIWG